MDSSMEEEDEFPNADDIVWKEEVNVSQLCRVCANPNEFLIPIFYGEGIEQNLSAKISKHLPIKVTEDDKLPTQLCYQCASTLIAWHDMVVGCLEADEKLKVLIGVEDTEISNEVSADKIGEFESQRLSPDKNRTAVVPSESVRRSGSFGVHKDSAVLAQETSLHNEFEPNGTMSNLVEEASEETSESRCSESFAAYHQTQMALRTQQIISSGSVFCFLCGKKKVNLTILLQHLSIEHKLRCGHCKKCFTNANQLSEHLLQHSYKTSEPKQVIKKNSKVILGKSESKKSRLKRNKSSSHLVKKGQFHCDSCSAVLSTRFNLKRHKMKYHLNEINGKENENNVVEVNENNKVSNKDITSSLHNSFNPEVEIDEESMIHSDSSVNSDDISKHLNVRTSSPLHSLDNNDGNKEMFPCHLCEFMCGTEQQRFVHHKDVHSLEGKKSCSFKVNKSKNLPTERSVCDFCEKSYSRNSDLKRHIVKVHSGKNISSNDLNSVDNDIDIINRSKQDINGMTVYHCGLCRKNLQSRKGFVFHMRAHTGERPFTCHICGKQYRSSTDLSRHLKCVHEGVRNYPCDICGRCFGTKGMRNDHRRTHTKERPFVCHTCGKSFATHNSIYVHRRTHTEYFPHQCLSCGKCFRTRQQLLHHSWLHTGEKPHACDVCGKCFRLRNDVLRHRLTHSAEKPHVCGACGLCFGQKRYLTNHVKAHHSRTLHNQP